ncbi:unnamed protein product [Nesidiocoris tenuis]|uniref:Uncharacterized protein n=1 Tax=Nesidiocoris tenuis TaxID=355587 RepID=A0A6H5G4A6_9HEMI|nr:unnamed protein product [Nesidiocoris tenuis]CAA9997349.1 unnamed protein product [Nesidiocoris tenuis]
MVAGSLRIHRRAARLAHAHRRPYRRLLRLVKVLFAVRASAFGCRSAHRISAGNSDAAAGLKFGIERLPKARDSRSKSYYRIISRQLPSRRTRKNRRLGGRRGVTFSRSLQGRYIVTIARRRKVMTRYGTAAIAHAVNGQYFSDNSNPQGQKVQKLTWNRKRAKIRDHDR